jgi:hypothetical protein
MDRVVNHQLWFVLYTTLKPFGSAEEERVEKGELCFTNGHSKITLEVKDFC